ncbi:hypothetical protein DSCO28_20060 [Desulfosarcina ovata subsp. sediminis]|uniref:TatD family hydrolase n=1 Tax=Desulfosarcina ovata subsp. sediminis TaxID=885957 RepID=A0A5K7ZQ44_9BACT|nr:TatD family hydrolase [Desulfosarcina ovata]BBO81440.1 hypothetical protein DSCO28_20060 [Desulfosarcina ovata subsp. sediminis]
MTISATILDSHVHLDLLARHRPQRIEWLKANRCAVVSWAYFENVQSVDHFAECLAAKAACIHTHAAAGLACYYLSGVHPRSIPPDLKPEQIDALLEESLADPLCLGIGEIGLETGDAREKEILIAQLEIGRRMTAHGKAIGVHTPRANKAAITAITLAMLADFGDLCQRLVIDHCTADTIKSVLDAGFWSGVTLSPVKTAWTEMKQILANEPARIGRIMGNTDSGSTFFEDVVQARNNEEISESLREKLFFSNALRFYSL